MVFGIGKLAGGNPGGNLPTVDPQDQQAQDVLSTEEKGAEVSPSRVSESSDEINPDAPDGVKKSEITASNWTVWTLLLAYAWYDSSSICTQSRIEPRL